jgi:hypothetical protein
MTKSSLVTAVEVRTSNKSQTTVWEQPVRVEQRDDMTALVFSTVAGVFPVVTVLLTGADRIALIELLGGTA